VRTLRYGRISVAVLNKQT